MREKLLISIDIIKEPSEASVKKENIPAPSRNPTLNPLVLATFVAYIIKGLHIGSSLKEFEPS